jgi:hypothetical protein
MPSNNSMEYKRLIGLMLKISPRFGVLRLVLIKNNPKHQTLNFKQKITNINPYFCRDSKQFYG